MLVLPGQVDGYVSLKDREILRGLPPNMHEVVIPDPPTWSPDLMEVTFGPSTIRWTRHKAYSSAIPEWGTYWWWVWISEAGRKYAPPTEIQWVPRSQPEFSSAPLIERRFRYESVHS